MRGEAASDTTVARGAGLWISAPVDVLEETSALLRMHTATASFWAVSVHDVHLH